MSEFKSLKPKKDKKGLLLCYRVFVFLKSISFSRATWMHEMAMSEILDIMSLVK